MCAESEMEVKTTMESEQTAEPTAELADTEAQAVIQTVEPILKNVRKK